jgi:hypothetical protein
MPNGWEVHFGLHRVGAAPAMPGLNLKNDWNGRKRTQGGQPQAKELNHGFHGFHG